MNNAPPLTVGFLRRQPHSAARTLDKLDAEEAAAFLADIPAGVSAPVVALMSPWASARCFNKLRKSAAVRIIQHLSYPDAVGLIRLINEKQQTAILTKLPSDHARHIKNSLSYPPESVGAVMDQSVASFLETQTAKEALRQAKSLRRVTGAHLFVVDAAGRYQGLVSLHALLRAKDTETLKGIMDTRAASLSSRATITSVADLKDWDRFAMLPVVNRNRAMIGALSYQAVRQALDERDAALRHSEQSTSLLIRMLSAYLLTSTELIRVAASGVVAPIQQEGHSEQTSGPRN